MTGRKSAMLLIAAIGASCSRGEADEGTSPSGPTGECEEGIAFCRGACERELCPPQERLRCLEAYFGDDADPIAVIAADRVVLGEDVACSAAVQGAEIIVLCEEAVSECADFCVWNEDTGRCVPFAELEECIGDAASGSQSEAASEATMLVLNREAASCEDALGTVR